eukprot:TRINITY_DN37402_c0_g1_i1.p1 TRINITY_DN37402_c0_g1~~TRINITY_DN37402_c0_g1_i1.p1  ORF type:complete len:283 (-),score=76.19 TRINITY_DN37402_c0_g1_i1:34-855(-)
MAKKTQKRKVMTLEGKVEISKKTKKVTSEKTEQTKIDQVFGMKESDVADLKEKAQKIELQEKENDNPEETESSKPVREKVKVVRKQSVIKSKSKKDEQTYISLSNPQEDNKAPKAAKRKSFRSNCGIIYLSHIPHGFYEKQMREFFSQFGCVTNLRLGRSKMTGRSKGYAFIEFQFMEVAKIVAETMNNYLMFNRIMKCQLLPKESSPRAIFSGKVKPSMPPGLVSRRKNKLVHNAEKSKEGDEKRRARQKKKINKVGKILADQGIDYKIQIS